MWPPNHKPTQVSSTISISNRVMLARTQDQGMILRIQHGTCIKVCQSHDDSNNLHHRDSYHSEVQQCQESRETHSAALKLGSHVTSTLMQSASHEPHSTALKRTDHPLILFVKGFIYVSGSQNSIQQPQRAQLSHLPWRNWLARSTVNREVPSSSLGGRVISFVSFT